MFETLMSWLPMLMAGAAVGYVLMRRGWGAARAYKKQEALFTSMFPDLQPYFHPAKVADYVVARSTRLKPNVRFTWKNPPGFGVAAADVDPTPERESVRLLDAAGQAVAQFTYEDHPEGGVLRLGKGKFTANTLDMTQPRVRYWHPDREFKWTPKSWKFVTRMAEQPIDSSDRGTSFSSDSPSTSSIATGAAVATGIAAAGGAFDGGGASQAWADGGRGGAGGSDSASASSTSY